MTTLPWQPILTGPAATRALAIVDDIAMALAARPPSDQPGFKGDAATALLLGECELDGVALRLEHALTLATTTPMTIALLNGIAGLAWLLDQLAAGPEVAALLDHFDAALSKHLAVPRWNDRLDLVSGLAGAGVMLAQRGDSRARRIAERVLAHLEAAAVATPEGIVWRTDPDFLPEVDRPRFPDGMIDVGVAHGVPGVIGMLAQFIEVGIEPARSRALLEPAIAWLRSAPDDCPRFGTSWPVEPGRKRIGWCYGDIGVGAVLLHAGHALDEPRIADFGLDLLRRLLPILDHQQAPDASFCHGAAGIAHVYNVAYQRTGEPALRDQAVHWLQRVIELRTPGHGIAGYRSLKIDPPQRWEDDATLLTGVVGTALVLRAATTEHEPAWPRLFAI